MENLPEETQSRGRDKKEKKKGEGGEKKINEMMNLENGANKR